MATFSNDDDRSRSSSKAISTRGRVVPVPEKDSHGRKISSAIESRHPEMLLHGSSLEINTKKPKASKADHHMINGQRRFPPSENHSKNHRDLSATSNSTFLKDTNKQVLVNSKHLVEKNRGSNSSAAIATGTRTEQVTSTIKTPGREQNPPPHLLTKANLAAFQAIHQPEKSLPPLLKKEIPNLLSDNSRPHYLSPPEESPIASTNLPINLFPPSLDFQDFQFPTMMPVPYYAFPFIDYRAFHGDGTHSKDPNQPGNPFPFYATVPPSGLLAQPDPSTGGVPLALLTPSSPGALLCPPPQPEAPLFGPGPPIITGERLKGPRGCNLFVFHLPNEITNWDLYLLFRRYGTILSVHIMVNKATGLSKGYGFVSFAYPNDAKNALQGMDGFRLGKKRLKVQLKRLQDDSTDEFHWEDACPDDTQSVTEPVSGQTSTSTTSQTTPNKANHEPFRRTSNQAVPTQVKLQEATKRLRENLTIDGEIKTHYPRARPRESKH